MRSIRRWGVPAFIAVAAAFFAITTVVQGQPVLGLVPGLVLLAFAVVISPLIFPRDSGWAAGKRRSREQSAPLILWKPGCSFCIAMRLKLGAAGNRAVWVDIERDPEAAAETRLRNDGNETTPTVITATETRTNPSPSWVRAQLLRR